MGRKAPFEFRKAQTKYAAIALFIIDPPRQLPINTLQQQQTLHPSFYYTTPIADVLAVYAMMMILLVQYRSARVIQTQNGI